MKRILPVRLLFFTALSVAIHAGVVAFADSLIRPYEFRQAKVNSDNLTLSARFAVISRKTQPDDSNPPTNMRPPEASDGLSNAIPESTIGPHLWNYLPASALDERPAPIRFFDLSSLTLPQTARGKLIVQLWINEAGTIDFLEIEQSDVPDIMTKEILEQWRTLQFVAGMKDGARVKTVARYEITLAPEPPQGQGRTTETIVP